MQHPRHVVHDLLAGDGVLFASAFPKVDAVRARDKLESMVLFGGSAVPALAEEVAYELDRQLGVLSLARFADGEVGIKVDENVRGKDVFVIQSTSQPVNENLVELLLTITALRRASAREITAVIPYYGASGGPSGWVEGARVSWRRHSHTHLSPAPHTPYTGYMRDVGTASTMTHDLRSAQHDSLQPPAPPPPEDELWLQTTAGSLALGADPPPPLPQEDWGRQSSYPVSAADIAKMLEAAGVDRIISVDMQPQGASQIEGFFAVPVEVVRSSPIAIRHLSKMDLQRPVVVAPNEACIILANDIAHGLRYASDRPVGFAMTVEAGPSRGNDRYVHRGSVIRNSEEPAIELVGDVRGECVVASWPGACARARGRMLASRVCPHPLPPPLLPGCDVVIVDAMIDTAGTLMRRVKLLRDRGARRVVAYATHGLFNGGALARITRSPLSEVIVTNTVPLREDVDVRHTHKIVQLSVAPILAEAILRSQLELSLQALRSPSFGGRSAERADARYAGQE